MIKLSVSGNGFALLLCGMFSFPLAAQQLISTASGGAVIGTVYMEGSVGESVIQTGTAGETTFTQGFHQPDITITGIDRLTEIPGEMLIYPNPVRTFLHIQPEGFPADSRFSGSLTDMTGKTLLDVEFDESGAQLQTGDLPAAQYFLRIQSKGTVYTELFKIIKTN